MFQVTGCRYQDSEVRGQTTEDRAQKTEPDLCFLSLKPVTCYL